MLESAAVNRVMGVGFPPPEPYLGRSIGRTGRSGRPDRCSNHCRGAMWGDGVREHAGHMGPEVRFKSSISTKFDSVSSNWQDRWFWSTESGFES